MEAIQINQPDTPTACRCRPTVGDVRREGHRSDCHAAAYNLGLMTKGLDHVRNLASAEDAGQIGPHKWRQGTWRYSDRCGTAMCYAGWVDELAGGEWVNSGFGAAADLLFADLHEPNGTVLTSDEDRHDFGVEDAGVYITAANRADNLLGLPVGHNVYSSSNTLEELEDYVAAAERGEDMTLYRAPQQSDRCPCGCEGLAPF